MQIQGQEVAFDEHKRTLHSRVRVAIKVVCLLGAFALVWGFTATKTWLLLAALILTCVGIALYHEHQRATGPCVVTDTHVVVHGGLWRQAM